MRRMLLHSLVLAVVAGPVAAASADEPLPPPHPLPLPPPLPPPGPMLLRPPRVPMPYVPGPTAFYRPSAYGVWQTYSVTWQGRFRPRVLYLPYGSFYQANGAPFPWSPVKTQEYMPYAADSWPSAGGPIPAFRPPLPPPSPGPLMPYIR